MKKFSVIILVLVMVLLPSRARAAISFVGSCSANGGNGANATLDLTSLSGGSDTSPSTDDLVIVAYGNADADNSNLNMDAAALLTGNGYTEAADLFSNDTFDANLGVYWKIMGATPDTEAVADNVGGADTDTPAVCMVFRGVDTSSPMDATDVEATGLDTMDPDPGEINHNNPSGVWTVIVGANAHNLGNTTFTFPTGYTTDAAQIAGNDTSDGVVGMGYNTSPSDPENPGVMTDSGSDSTSFAWAAVTMALRPASAVAPTLDTAAATNVGAGSATLNGEITAAGGANSTVRGFAFGTNSGLTGAVSTTTESGSFGAATFTQNISGLLAGVTYYYRAYATNPAGTGYGDIVEFTSGTDNTPSRLLRLFEGFKLVLASGRLILCTLGPCFGSE
jgi:hypothetical protein